MNDLENWELVFIIPLAPCGKARARGTGGGRFYTPLETRAMQRITGNVARREMRLRKLKPLTGPVWFRVTAFFCDKEKIGEWAAVKPDWDNIGKLVSDALNGIAYIDDKQIVDSSTKKIYGNGNAVVVTVRPALPMETAT